MSSFTYDKNSPNYDPNNKGKSPLDGLSTPEIEEIAYSRNSFFNSAFGTTGVNYSTSYIFPSTYTASGTTYFPSYTASGSGSGVAFGYRPTKQAFDSQNPSKEELDSKNKEIAELKRRLDNLSASYRELQNINDALLQEKEENKLPDSDELEIIPGVALNKEDYIKLMLHLKDTLTKDSQSQLTAEEKNTLIHEGAKVWILSSGEGPYVAISQALSKHKYKDVDGVQEKRCPAWILRDSKGKDITIPVADISLCPVEKANKPTARLSKIGFVIFVIALLRILYLSTF